ncbi:hypothetical protein GCM10023224_05340 [Streptomonospora halophila]|uniref:Uncharacterized protein n=1 Tax=Streptomonospora halophila TaxID=427369 RepID=A0ABP9G676_9ACTN
MQDAEAPYRALVVQVLRNAPDGADPEVTAADILHVLRGHGFRPSQARVDVEEWRSGSAAPATPEQARAYAERIRRSLADGDGTAR